MASQKFVYNAILYLADSPNSEVMPNISFRLMLNHERMLLILISKMYYSESRKRGSLLLDSLVQRA